MSWSVYILPLAFAALGFFLACRLDESRSEWIIKLGSSLAGGGVGYLLHRYLWWALTPAGG